MRSSFASLLAFAMLALAMAAIDHTTNSAWAQSGDPIAPGSSVSLQLALQKGLRCRRPVEFDFVNRVTQMVDDGELPQSVVVSAYLWARRHRPYPYPYFYLALQAQYPNVGNGLIQ